MIVKWILCISLPLCLLKLNLLQKLLDLLVPVDTYLGHGWILASIVSWIPVLKSPLSHTFPFVFFVKKIVRILCVQISDGFVFDMCQSWYFILILNYTASVNFYNLYYACHPYRFNPRLVDSDYSMLKQLHCTMESGKTDVHNTTTTSPKINITTPPVHPPSLLISSRLRLAFQPEPSHPSIQYCYKSVSVAMSTLGY